MEMNPRGERAPYFNFSLLLISLVAIIPRWRVETGRYIEFDGYWHVWIAQQDRWINFLREYRDNAHPPLFFLLLRVITDFARSPLAYRSISLLTGIVSVWLLGKTAAKITKSLAFAAGAALAYGLALPSIQMSNEVRSYTLAAFMVQISFYFFLDLVGTRQPLSLRPRVLFAVTAALACLTEYDSVFYVVAASLTAAAFAWLNQKSIRALAHETFTFVLILLPAVGEYLYHFGAQAQSYDHLPGFYYVWHSEELPGDFLFRDFRNELNLFLPWHTAYGFPYYATIAILVAGAVGTIFLCRPGNSKSNANNIENNNENKNAGALATLAVGTLILCILMAGGVWDLYPFGGYLRQQYILLPFAILCIWVAADRLAQLLPSRFVPAAALVLAMIATGLNLRAERNYELGSFSTRNLFQDQMDRFNADFPAPAVTYLDKFNLLVFFLHHHDWKWQSLGSPGPKDPELDVYRISNGSESRTVVFDTEEWQADYHEHEIYEKLIRVMQEMKQQDIAVFGSFEKLPPAFTPEQQAGFERKIVSRMAETQLCAEKTDVNRFGVYAEFRPAGTCSAR